MLYSRLRDCNPFVDMGKIIYSFDPIVDDKSRVLILGTMPGVESLRKQEYYGHPRNAFWPIIAAVCGRELPVSYSGKTAMLLDGGIALWDVCRGCEREGSLDSNICNETPNAIDRLLATHPNIQTLFFNGQNAERLFKRYFPEIWKLSRHHTLPSTSPAYTLPFEKKRDAWSIVGLR